MNRTALFALPLLAACATEPLRPAPAQPVPAEAPSAVAPPAAKVLPVLQDPAVLDLQKKIARFAPVDIGADLGALPANERKALALIVEASRVMDPLFVRQVWAGNEAVMFRLLEDRDSPLAKVRLHAFLVNKGPWSRLDEDKPFLAGIPAKPEAGNFYPAGTTKQDVERWIASLSPEKKKEATGFFTTIRKDAQGKLVAVPYSVEYQGELARMAELLREAAAATAQPTLKDFLLARADAFLSNDYYASDVAWMKLDASIEPTIGPYEVYEDEWFNYKAAFEAFVALRDDQETAKLARFSSELQEIENHLPIEPKYRNPKLGALAPIRVVNSIFSAGDGNRGVQTAAYNLPNDERITEQMGTKRVMLKNIQEAKFHHALVPIAQVALAPQDRPRVDFDAFFTHILMHELMHGLGPHNISKGAQKTTVREAIQETYSTVEEAKADISGLFAMQYLVNKGSLDKKFQDTMYVTFLASAFRSIRFGLNEAHGRGIALQLNWLLDHGAFQVNPDGTFKVDDGKIQQAVADLTRELMTLEAQGDKAKALELLSKMAVIRPQVQAVLDKLGDVPVDIEPRYVTAERLANE